MGKNIVRGILVIMAFLYLVIPVQAAPSSNGSTGLINIPSADVLRTGQAAVGYYHGKDTEIGVISATVFPRWEVSAARWDEQTLINIKWSVLGESVLGPGLALGVEDMGDRERRSCYAVASKTLPFGFRFHLGMGNGHFDGVFAGVEKTLNPLRMQGGKNSFPVTTLIAEFDGTKMNYGLRMALLTGMKLDAGWRNHDSYYGLSGTVKF